MMLFFATLVGLITFVFWRSEEVWLSFLVAFFSVFLAGIVSLAVICGMRKRYAQRALDVLAATFLRAMIVAVTIGFVIATQSKGFIFDVLCLTIVFYLGMLPVHAWLTMPGKDVANMPKSVENTRQCDTGVRFPKG